MYIMWHGLLMSQDLYGFLSVIQNEFRKAYYTGVVHLETLTRKSEP